MNPRLAILAVALVLAIAAAVVLRRTAASGDLTPPSASSPALASPSKTARTDDAHHPDRFHGLAPSLRQIAMRLEDLNLAWERNRPPVRGGHADWNDWLQYALQQASQLETSQIEALIDWLETPDNDYATEVWEYRQAFYQTWASRDPEAARDHVIALAMEHGVLPPEQKNLWRTASLDDVADMYHFVLAGSAVHDPAKAWKTFRDDLSDPIARNLRDANVTTQEIFKAYASRAPAEAWHLVLTEPDEDFIRRMFEGYADGAPARQDWEALGSELIASLEPRDVATSDWAYRHLAERWVTENPAAALDWFAAHATLYGNDHFNDDPFAPGKPLRPEELPPGEYQQRLKLALLEEMYGSHKDRTDEVVQVLDRLLAEGDAKFVTTALRSLTGSSLQSWCTPLFAVVPNIPDPDLRHEEFLRLVQAIHPRDNDEFSHGNNPFPEPNIPYEAIRELADKLDLPPDIRAQAEAAFQELEAQEARARAERREEERADPNPVDPLAP